MIKVIYNKKANKKNRRVGTDPTLNVCLGGFLLAKIEEKIETLLSDVIVNLGYELYDVEYVKEGKDYFLRIYIDKENGISLDDCEKVNNAIDGILEKADYIKDKYFLEISSTGVERTLRKDKHLKKSLGEKVEVKLFKQMNKEKKIVGILENFDTNNIYVKVAENNIQIDRKNVALIKTVYDW